MSVSEKKLTGYPSIDKPWMKYYSEEAINAPLPSGSCYDFMKERNQGRDTETALSYFGRKLSHQELDKKIELCAKALTAKGVQKGDFVSICLLAMPETVILFYAINRIGAISNFVEINATDKQILEQIEGVNSKLIFTVDMVTPKILASVGSQVSCEIVSIPLSQSMPWHLKTVFAVKNVGKMENMVLSWQKFLALGRDVTLPLVKIQAEDLAVLEYTGGTTGNPKGVMLSNQAVNTVALNYILSDTVLDFKKGDKMLDIIPPFLAYGLFIGIHLPLCVGMEDILSPDPSPQNFPKMLLKTRPNHFSGGPMHIRAMMQDIKVQKADLSFIKVAAWGGDGISKESAQEATNFLQSHGAKYEIIDGYGMTETASSFCTKTHHTPQMIPFVKNNVMVLDVDTGEELKYGQKGEICLSGPSVMQGYWKNEKVTEETLFQAKGTTWIHTGDLGYVTEEGYFYISGRLKRILYVIGEDEVPLRVYPMEVERVLGMHESVSDCAVVGRKSSMNGYTVIAFVILKKESHMPDNAQIIEELKKLCKQELPEHSLPKEYHIMEEFPKTIAGKTDFRELEKMAEEKS